jgi:SAM-dependent methyltransferase
VSNQSVQALSQLIVEYSNSSEHPDLQVYRRDIDQFDWDRFNWWMGHVARIGNFYGDKRVLEIGCGFGWEAVALSIETGATVTAMDILPSMIEGVRECLDTMRAKGHAFKVEPLVGDICNVDLPPNSFDGMFSSEAVEHVHDLEQMYDRCFMLLKKGGRLIIANDSNAYNSAFRARNFEMWPERDGSLEHVEWLKQEVRPREHADAEPYAVMRERMIRAIEPNLPDEDMKALVHATAGLIEPEIQAATRAYKSDGTLPTRPEWSWCRNPATGEYAERLLDPFAMAGGLKRAGFKVRIQHGMRKFPARLLNDIGIRAINKQIFERKPLFVLVAEKP